MWSIVIAVCVQNHHQAVKVILASKNWSWLHSIFGVPDSKAIAKQFTSFSVHFKTNLQLPVTCSTRL